MYPNWHVLGADIANHQHFQQYSALHIHSKKLIMFTQSVKQWEVCGYGSAD